MQDVIEVTRITKDTNLEIVDKVRKLIEWRDVISIEEGGQEVISELEENELTLLTLSYGEIVVTHSYDIIKAKWLKFRREAEKADHKLNNLIN